MPIASQSRQREIRVFISSTFRDMQEEREELVKQIFPQLRRLCESRGVTWGEVDLRWGVSDEAKAEGKVLPLCLAEIEKLPALFYRSARRALRLGAGGDSGRTARSAALAERAPQTVRYGPRDTSWRPAKSEDGQACLLLLPRSGLMPQRIAGFTEEDAALRQRLASLKDDIRKSGFPVSELRHAEAIGRVGAARSH